MSVVNATMRALVEGFTNPGAADAYRQPPVYVEAMAAVLGFFITVAIVSLVGLWLWNYSVVPLFEFARPAKSIFQILGLMVFVSLIHA